MKLVRSTFYRRFAGQPLEDARLVEQIGEICAEYPSYGYRLSAKNAGQTSLYQTTQAASSTSTWYAFAGQVSDSADALSVLWQKGGYR
jgi:hypothetical protein